MTVSPADAFHGVQLPLPRRRGWGWTSVSFIKHPWAIPGSGQAEPLV